MKKYAIIVAGGSGTRMKSDVPKQFLKLRGIPIIIRTIRQFMLTDETISLLVVLPEKHLSFWEDLKAEYPFLSSINVTRGGASRTESVKSGLRLIPSEGVVAIHDAVRPFVSTEIIIRSYQSAMQTGSGIAAVSLKDSIRELMDNGSSVARNRDQFVLVQTPQTFRVDQIKESYENLEGHFSDDATVFEKKYGCVSLVEGSYENIKITTPEDLK